MRIVKDVLAIKWTIVRPIAQNPLLYFQNSIRAGIVDNSHESRLGGWDELSMDAREELGNG
jgi:hypothetical protein